MTRVTLPGALRARILVEARQALPRECCGLVEGLRLQNASGEEFHITALHSARNLSAQADRFEIAPQDHFQAFKTARANGRALIGCYHSHPNGRTEPSAADKLGAAEEDFLWLVAAGERVEAFVYRRGEFSAAGWLCLG